MRLTAGCRSGKVGLPVRRVGLITVLLTLLISVPANAQAPVLEAPFNKAYSITDLGAPAGVPTRFGGLTLRAGTTNKLLLGGAANSADGALYEVTVTRNAQGHINGFTGTATRAADAAYNDGGVTYGPGGVLFLARWPNNELGQTKPGSAITDKITSLSTVGIESSLASLLFVPSGLPGAGRLKMASYGGGAWYDATVKPDGAGTYDLVGPKEVTASRLSGGPEGFVYVARGSAQFPKPSLIVSEYGADQVATYEVDADGDPVVATRRTMISGLDGAEGAFIDPVTGDYLFSTFGGTNRVIVVSGFSKPPPPPVAGKKVNVFTVKGTVKVKRKGKKGFATLKAGDQIPTGSTVDTTKGRVTLVTEGKKGATDQADFYDGIFKITQSKKSKLTTLTLVEKLSCGAGKASVAKKKKKKRRLWGDGKGNFQTRGKNSAATVLGTKWLVEDSCSATTTRVARGVVSVRDFVKKKTVKVKAGHKYVARSR
jgi:hypothetical protein